MNTMLAQIYSLPSLLRDIFDPFDDAVRSTLDDNLCRSVKRLYVTGCGDSHHAALGSELAFEALSGVPVEPMTAMQFARYAAADLPEAGPRGNVVVGISVSGEVSRTVEALKLAQRAKATTIALTATPGSRMAQTAERALLVQAPPFPDPPGTVTPGVRSYTSNLIALYLMAVRLGEARGRLAADEGNHIRDELRRLADAVERTLAVCDGAARSLAEEWADAQEFVFLGAGPNYGTALFSAAKVLEASGDAVVAQDTEEWAHLQYFARAVSTPTFIISAGGRDLSRAVEVAVAAKTIGRSVVAVAPPSASALSAVAARILLLPEGTREMFSPLVAAIPLELFAAYRADVLSEPFFRAFGGGRSIEGGGGISRIRTSAIIAD
ncbi:MAG: SIS domain-containing protein [Chloroflexi bacterium]|nr:SIS domain-containing protein [Chloroflexota bacterium]